MGSFPFDPGADPVRVALSLDRTWLHRVGISRFTYERMIRRAGGQPIRLRFSSGIDASGAASLLEGIGALLLSGGGDVDPRLYGAPPETGLDVRPARDAFEQVLLAEADRRRLPVLGIGRGLQILNVVRGGTLRNLRGDPTIWRRHGRFATHSVRLVPGSRLADLLGEGLPGAVTSYHAQSIGEPGRGVRVVGWSDDGVIEAIEAGSPDRWVVGVQWHPELLCGDAMGRRLFAAFVAAARHGEEAMHR